MVKPGKTFETMVQPVRIVYFCLTFTADVERGKYMAE